MGEKYCVFLRGVNVNGINIKMNVLKEAFCNMGFQDPKTILATGNVIIYFSECNSYRQKLKSFIEEELSKYFQYDAHVIILSNKEIQEICAAAQTIDVPEGFHNYCLLSDDKELFLELKDLFDAVSHMPSEKLVILECGTFWIVSKGDTLNSHFGSKVLGNKKYKSRLTSRNINTIQKVYKSMAGL